jgi:hypothetical protein
MKDITDNLKKIGIGLVLIALTSLPLNAQNYGLNHAKKVKDDYCLSKEGRDYDKNVYTKSIMGRPTFISKEARNYNKKVYANGRNSKNSCVQNEYMKYNVHLHKITGIRER